MVNTNEEAVECNLGADDHASGASFKEEAEEDYEEKTAGEEEEVEEGDDSSNLLPLLDMAEPPGPGGTSVQAVKRKPLRRMSEEQKKRRRILSNRRSAKATRDNRRQLLTQLSSKLAVLSAENKSLAKVNAGMCAQTQHLKQLLQLALDSVATHASVTANPSRQAAGWLPRGGLFPYRRHQELRFSVPSQLHRPSAAYLLGDSIVSRHFAGDCVDPAENESRRQQNSRREATLNPPPLHEDGSQRLLQQMSTRGGHADAGSRGP